VEGCFEVGAVAGLSAAVIPELAVALSWSIAVAATAACVALAVADVDVAVGLGLAGFATAVFGFPACAVKSELTEVVLTEQVVSDERKLQAVAASVDVETWKQELARAGAPPTASSWQLHMEKWERNMVEVAMHMQGEVESMASMD